MAKRIAPLTNTQVKQCKALDKEYTLSDGNGLQLRIKPIGSKTWVLKYSKLFTKVRTNIGLVNYPEVSLANAREKREVARELLAKSIDPKVVKDQEKLKQQEIHNNTFQVVAQSWFGIKEPSISNNYTKDIWRSLDLHVFPSLGKHPITHLTAPLVIATLKRLRSQVIWKLLDDSLSELMK